MVAGTHNPPDSIGSSGGLLDWFNKGIPTSGGGGFRLYDATDSRELDFDEAP